VAKKTAINRMAREIQALYPVSKKRAKLIATDQTIKLTAAVEEKRQRDAGVTSYTWETMRDIKVRKRHRERQGKVYSWTSPPSGGHPGSEINCRCHAKPKF
jgi:SPP1 gp7 family putative phage head morphogenesis protein